MVSHSSNCPDGLHLVKQRRGHLTECEFSEVHLSRSAITSSHRCQSNIFFLFAFLLQASISGDGELCVRFIFTVMLYAKVIQSPLVSNKNTKEKFRNQNLSQVSQSIISLETHQFPNGHTIFLGFNDKKIAIDVKKCLSLVIQHFLSEVLTQSVGNSMN